MSASSSVAVPLRNDSRSVLARAASADLRVRNPRLVAGPGPGPAPLRHTAITTYMRCLRQLAGAGGHLPASHHDEACLAAAPRSKRVHPPFPRPWPGRCLPFAHWEGLRRPGGAARRTRMRPTPPFPTPHGTKSLKAVSEFLGAAHSLMRDRRPPRCRPSHQSAPGGGWSGPWGTESATESASACCAAMLVDMQLLLYCFSRP